MATPLDLESNDIETDSWSEFDLEGDILDFLKWIVYPRKNATKNMEVDLTRGYSGVQWEINLNRTGILDVQHDDFFESEIFQDNADTARRSGLGTLECALLSVFGTLVTIFFCVQLIIYVRYCSARRQSWQVEPKQEVILENGASTLGRDTSSASWAHMYDPYSGVPRKNGLKFTRSRPRGVLYLSDLDSDSPPSDGRSTFSSTLYMMDQRGHVPPHEVTVTSPEVALELYQASRVSSRGSLRSLGQVAPPVPERNASSGSRTPLAIPLLCENPAYESDASPAASSYASGIFAGSRVISNMSQSPASSSPLTLGDLSDNSSFTSVSSLSDLSAPALLGLYWKHRSPEEEDPERGGPPLSPVPRRIPKAVSFSGYLKHQPLGARVSSASGHANIYKCKAATKKKTDWIPENIQCKIPLKLAMNNCVK